MIAVFFVLTLLVASYNAQDLEEAKKEICPDSNVSYRLHLIDARIKMKMKMNMEEVNCTHLFTLNSGNCSLTGLPSQEHMKGYVCFNQTGEYCDYVDLKLLTGYSIMNCSGNVTVAAIKPEKNIKLGKEFRVSSEMAEARIAIGYKCNTTNETGSNKTWEPSGCLLKGDISDIFPTSFSYGVQAGFAMILLILAVLL